MIVRNVDSDSIDVAAAYLAAGKAVIFPTDTVYGIVVAAGIAMSADEIYAIKKRDPEKAIPWLVGSVEALLLYGQDVPEYALDLAKKNWPGALTIIVKAADTVPQAFQAHDGTIALRMPNDKTALELINKVGFPLATSSANKQGAKPACLLAEVNPALLQKVAAYIGDNLERSGISSTVVDCTSDAPRVIRQGSVVVA